MRVSLFMTAIAAVWLAYGTGFALIPAAIWSLYGVDLDAAGLLMARFLAASSLGLAAVSWLERQAEVETVRNVNVALLITSAGAIVASLMGLLSGVMGPLGWANVGLLLLMGVGHGYFALTAR